MADLGWHKAGEPAREFRRTVNRDRLTYRAQVFRPGGIEVDVSLIDLSCKGFQASCGSARFARGESIQIALPLVGTLNCRIMWSLPGCFGAQFMIPIDARGYLDMIAVMQDGEGAIP